MLDQPSTLASLLGPNLSPPTLTTFLLNPTSPLQPSTNDLVPTVDLLPSSKTPETSLPTLTTIGSLLLLLLLNDLTLLPPLHLEATVGELLLLLEEDRTDDLHLLLDAS